MIQDGVEVRKPTLILEEEAMMTNATMALAELAEKGADVDVLRQMVQFAATRPSRSPGARRKRPWAP